MKIKNLLFLGAVLAMPVLANDLTVSNTTLAPTAAPGVAAVTFDLAWDNSWRDIENHDAAWVFIKFSPDGGTRWRHATLAASGVNPAGFAAGTGTEVEIRVTADKKGAMVNRVSDVSGTLSVSGMTFLWNYAADGISSRVTPIVRVFGIEMVYVPAGPFFFGEQDNVVKCTPWATFIDTGDMSKVPDRGTGSNTDPYRGSAGCGREGQVSGNFNAGFPNGYKAFYIMKHELSESQYVAMLNTLAAEQATSSYTGTDNGGNTIRPVILNDFACVYTSSCPERAAVLAPPDHTAWRYAATFVDWAALRPSTDMEIYKACRGQRPIVAKEYVWGSGTGAVSGSQVLNAGTAEEVSAVAGANVNANVGGLLNRAMRVGAFAAAGTDRVAAGAGYFGVLNMADNVIDRTLSSGSSNGGRSNGTAPEFPNFDGQPGDGELEDSGMANVPSWPPPGNYTYAGMGGSTGASGDGVRLGRKDEWIYFYDTCVGGMRAARSFE